MALGLWPDGFYHISLPIPSLPFASLPFPFLSYSSYLLTCTVFFVVDPVLTLS